MNGQDLVWLSLTSQVIQVLQHLLLSGKVQGEGVKVVRQMDLWDQHLSGRCCHGNPGMTGKFIFKDRHKYSFFGGSELNSPSLTAEL